MTALETSLDKSGLVRYLELQIDMHFPDGRRHDVATAVAGTLPLIATCFSAINHPAYGSAARPRFDHLHGDQYTTFIYFASRIAMTHVQDPILAMKLFLLNRALHGFICMHDVELPPVVYLNHVVGTVLGRATYGNYLVLTQNVTVGHDRFRSPTIGERVIIYGGAMIVGDSIIGDDVAIAPQSLIRHASIAASSMVAGRSPALIVKPRSASSRRDFFRSLEST